MARHAPNRIAGMLAATAICAAAATEAAAQQDNSIVLNNQLQLGDVISGQTLNVEGATDQVTVTNSAQGNSLAGSVEGGALGLRSTQTMGGDARATTTMTLGGDTAGVVNAITQSGGNYLAGGTHGATLEIDATQTVQSGEITAGSAIRGGTARLLHGGSVGTVAVGNTVALGGPDSGVVGTVSQTSAASIRSSNLAETQYLPAEAHFYSQALNNAVAVNTTAASYQNLGVRQRSTSDVVEADVSANAGNSWDLSSQSNATANQAVLTNAGGSMVVGTDQANTSRVRSTAIATSYEFGRAAVSARGVGNGVEAGNNDLYLELDNTQINSGGVEVVASFSGTHGYDAFVGADAAGNTVTGYACAACQGQMVVKNDQTNTGNVSATANTAVYGSGRAVITGANAVGNAATFYVSRPGQ